MEEKKDPPKTNAWTHGAQVGLGPVREAVQTTRDAVAATVDGLKAELDRKRAVAARFGKR
jgi:hypothetical protein